jgi:Condensation domain
MRESRGQQEPARGISLLPAQYGLYFNALRSGRFDKSRLAYRFYSTHSIEGLHKALSRYLSSTFSVSRKISWIGGEPRLVSGNAVRIDTLDLSSNVAARRSPLIIGDRLRDLEAAIEQSDSSAAMTVDLGHGQYEVYLAIDHISFDGGSIDVIEDALSALARGTDPPPPTTPQAVSDMLDREFHRVASFEQDEAREGTSPWIPQLPLADHGTSATVEIAVPKAHLAKVMTITRATEFQFFLTVYALAIAYVFASRDAVIAVPTGGLRLRDPDSLPTVGCFTNTVYVRVDMIDAATFHDAVSLVRRRTLDAIELDVPALAELNREFQLAASCGFWLIRRLNYPVARFIEPTRRHPELERFHHPVPDKGNVRRMMTLTAEKTQAEGFRLNVGTHSGIPDAAHRVASLMTTMLQDTDGTAVQAILDEVRGLPPASWQPKAARASPPEAFGSCDKDKLLAQWLRETLATPTASQVVLDRIAAAAPDRSRRPRTDIPSVVRLLGSHPNPAEGLPTDLIRRDTSPHGIALSRRYIGNDGWLRNQELLPLRSVTG